jgi:hypothetical protein
MVTLVMNTATYVKFDAFGLKNAKDQENTSFCNLDLDPIFFCGGRLSNLVAPNQIMSCVSKDHDNGNQILFLKQPKCFILKHQWQKKNVC